MVLKYTGTQPLFLKGYGKITTNDEINDEGLCDKLKGRIDFVNVESEVEEVVKPVFKPIPKPKPIRIAKSKKKY